MPTPNLVLLYVDDPAKSAAFYEDILGQSPKDRFPTYVAFAFDSGLYLGLLGKRSAALAELPADGQGSRGEIAFMVEDAAAVEALYDDWRGRGITIAQLPATLAFGRTFVALDPDGHRVRVCTPDK